MKFIISVLVTLSFSAFAKSPSKHLQADLLVGQTLTYPTPNDFVSQMTVSCLELSQVQQKCKAISDASGQSVNGCQIADTQYLSPSDGTYWQNESGTQVVDIMCNAMSGK